MTEDLKLAVKRGTYWLDENHPGWYQKIQLDRFSITNCEVCVVGQALEGGFYDLAMAMGVNWVEEHGFYLTDTSKYEDLEQLWLDVFKERSQPL